MRAFKLRQPWATLLCAGLRADNGTQVIGLYTFDAVVYALPSSMDFSFSDLPVSVALPVVNLENMGVLEPIDHLPFNAAVGVVTLMSDTSPERFFEAPDKYAFRLVSAKLFDRAIFDIDPDDELFTAGLPAIRSLPAPMRDGTTLRIPVSHKVFNNARRNGTDGMRLVFNLVDDNTHIFCNKMLEPKKTDRIVLISGDNFIVSDIRDYECYEVSANSNLSAVDYRDTRERIRRWSQVNITLD